MAEAALEALFIILDPMRLSILLIGVIAGLFLGLTPGIGGLVGMAILLPFTFAMDPFTAFALLIGITAVTGTSDTVPAVMFGVPGTSGAQATILDGHQMAKNGEASRALSAAYSSSLIGGLLGALFFILLIPILRPIVLNFRTPEMLALSIFGISMVAALSGKAPLKGLAAACIGILIAMVGEDPQTSTMRWTFGQLYLWDGVHLVIIVLGIFAVPELVDLATRKARVSEVGVKYSERTGLKLGIKDTFTNKWLIFRCSLLGSFLGMIPGIGASVVDWLNYGHALQTEKGAKETFGTGDVRGVIAPECANNAVTAGSLVPTVAFGIPGSATMAILIGAFMVQGIVPGPDMLSSNLNITYSLVWTVAIANIMGAGICFALSSKMAKLAQVKYSIILPIAIVIIYVGAYQSTRSWWDIYLLGIFSMVGIAMKHNGWPRPPLILGFVLGAMIERYFFIALNRYGMDMLNSPIVIGLLAISVLAFVGPTLRSVREIWKPKQSSNSRGSEPGEKSGRFDYLMYGAIFALAVYGINTSSQWPFAASIGPYVISISLLVAVVLSLLYRITRARTVAQPVVENSSHSPWLPSPYYRRLVMILLWAVLYGVLIFLVGIYYAIPIFITAFMLLDGKDRFLQSAITGICSMLFVYFVFGTLLNLSWPQPLLSLTFW